MVVGRALGLLESLTFSPTQTPHTMLARIRLLAPRMTAGIQHLLSNGTHSQTSRKRAQKKRNGSTPQTPSNLSHNAIPGMRSHPSLDMPRWPRTYDFKRKYWKNPSKKQKRKGSLVSSQYTWPCISQPFLSFPNAPYPY